MRILFCSLASPGFLYPFIGLAIELRRRNHEVAFATDVSFESELSELGLRRYPRGVQDGRSFHVPVWANSLAICVQVKHIEYAMHEFHPDVLVGQHLTLGPLIVKERQQIPVALMGSATFLYPFTGCVPRSLKRKEWRQSELMSSYNDARRMVGLAVLSGGECHPGPLLGDLFLLRTIPELETGHEAFGVVRSVGACLWERDKEDPELDAWVEVSRSSDAPIVYVQQGRFFHIPTFWSQAMRSLRGLGARVASSTGATYCSSDDAPNDSILRPHLPQQRILPFARAVIASANATAVLGALSAGVPMLLIPAGGEQSDIAEICQSNGLARIISPEEATPDKIRSELESLLHNSDMHKRAKQVANAFAAIDSVRVTASMLEQLAQSRKPQPLLRTAKG